MTERAIQLAILHDRWVRSTCLPNFTPRGWFECDVFELTKSGFFVEYEIKLTLSDFKADRQKFRRTTTGVFPDFKDVDEFKHDLITKGPPAPSRFFYVTAKGIVLTESVPAWAGHIEAEHPEGWRRPLLTIRRDAPRLHRQKSDPKLIEHIGVTSYYRFMRLFLRQ